MIDLSGGIISSLLLGLRIAPMFAFAPPFTLVRIPVMMRLLLALGLSVAMMAAHPGAMLPGSGLGVLIPAAARELALGTMFVLTLQLTFASLYLAGRTIDVQAGFGLALLIDPTSRSQTPLVGTLFAYAAGAVFFALDGHVALLRLVSASIDVIPLGAWEMPHSIERLCLFISAVFSIACGFAGAAIATIFLIDICIALLSRTVPQMNVLVLGFQVKTIALLVVLPMVFGLGGALLVRILALGIATIPTLV